MPSNRLLFIFEFLNVGTMQLNDFKLWNICFNFIDSLAKIVTKLVLKCLDLKQLHDFEFYFKLNFSVY